MPREGRLTKDSQYALVYDRGRTWRDHLLILKALPNDMGSNRYGFVASKRVGKAVVRNLVRRRLREIARSTPTRQGWDLVVVARSNAAEADYRQLDKSMKGLLGRAGLLADNAVGTGGIGKR